MHIFHPPAFEKDLDDDGLAMWHARMASTTTVQMALLLCELKQGRPDATSRNLAYVDPRKSAIPDGATVLDRSWSGFPRFVRELLAQGDDEKAWTIAEAVDAFNPRARGSSPSIAYVLADGERVDLPARVMQDEYLEWRPTVDEDGIKAVALTCEGPEYWEVLALQKPPILREKYEEVLGHQIPHEDLFFKQNVYAMPPGKKPGDKEEPAFEKGAYNPYNKWNTSEGIVHLTQKNNTLGAEINLAMRATVPRVDANGERVDEAAALTCCAGFGDPNRDSDPNIGITANRAAHEHQRLTLTDPIGLYISEFDTSGIALPAGMELPDGVPDPSHWWSMVRGQAAEKGPDGMSRMLRIEFEIPDGLEHDGKPLRLHDLTKGGAPITHAAAIAELVTMHLMVTAWEDKESEPLSLTCLGTCCPGEIEGELEPCVDGSNAKFPNLLTPGKTAKLCPERRSPVYDELQQKAAAEALAEYRESGPGTPSSDVQPAAPALRLAHAR